MSVYNYKVKYRSGELLSLSEYEGKVLLLVNTASKCGFTPQFAGLEELNQQYGDKGLQILGFPCNQFANQDPGDDETIQNFCQTNYGVSFPVFSRVVVNGKEAHPLFKHLKESARGVFWSKRIKWNFTKFLVDHNGNVVRRYAPRTKPEKLRDDIEKLLAQI
ncbi:glutathione peroxidase [Arenicella sp. 4NH20-0111]|uniref:glutathione peroxidase n=1 Tax=Arenicella sp. 4NH20-0111 TaxID=3127648 RepID=UPI003108F714